MQASTEPLRQPFSIVDILGLAVGVKLYRLLEKNSCPITNLCFAPAEPVYLVNIAGQPRIISKPAFCGQELLQGLTRGQASEKVMSVLGITGEQLNRIRSASRTPALAARPQSSNGQTVPKKRHIPGQVRSDVKESKNVRVGDREARAH